MLSSFRLFGKLQSSLNLYAEITHGGFQLGVPEQKLNRPKVLGLAVDERRLGPPQAVFCCTTDVRATTRPPVVMSLTRSCTRSQPRSLLSMAKLNKASSRVQRRSWSLTRIAQMSFTFNSAF